MNAAFLIFPHQLFKNIESLKSVDQIYLVEETLYFKQFSFHKQKLAFHRASMQHYVSFLHQNGFDANYVESVSPLSNTKELIVDLAKKGIKEIHCYRVSDNWLEKSIVSNTAEKKIKLIWHESPMFMLSFDEMNNEFQNSKTFFQTNFYIKQRKRFSILLNDEHGPEGGKWSFDADNRKPYPKNKAVPSLQIFPKSKWREEANKYVDKQFSQNPGYLNGEIQYPITHEEAESWLAHFIDHRLAEFGIYEDAMVANEHVLHHSVLTPMLNAGLITPRQVIDGILDASAAKGIPLNSSEGFIRQILGWREFMHGVYHAVGSKQRVSNFWGFNRKIPASFYNGTTGIAPVDDAIKKLLKTGYNHHIERLMILSNFMLLCEFDPNEVYKWFMEMYVDAYDWVMVPNVYGMGQFADGGLICTKPYISGSNYVLKMSNYKKDATWTDAWDGLFWRFMHNHRDFFLKNPRLGMLVRTFDKMNPDKRNLHLQNGEAFLSNL